ncbi:uncharacterized protein K02A2.6-like [Actinia tenebrosa]|uniref:Uncharacterized protein K02A2.6-like n=1 Tax=Actinia tenebrosa TaxID=6105 RepID=A0A6P8HDR0_ACTTE|nr:uncharacterized protein K02A2.6-like [Actinia tenebrosa]
MGRMFLIVVDSYSKWLEVLPMGSTTAQATLLQLRKLFATFGIPEHIVTDNGPQFTCGEFQEFMLRNNIKHTLTPPGHPASNGMAEKYVQHFKSHMKKMKDNGSTLEENLATTPHSATGDTPSHLLMKRQLRTWFSNLRPGLVSDKEQSVFEKNCKCEPRFKELGDAVFVLNLRSGPRWLPGTVIDVLQRSYYIQVDEHVYKRHEDQLRPRMLDMKVRPEADRNLEPLLQTPVPLETAATPEMAKTLKTSVPAPFQPAESPHKEKEPSVSEVPKMEEEQPPGLRRNPERQRRPPLRYRE